MHVPFFWIIVIELMDVGPRLVLRYSEGVDELLYADGTDKLERLAVVDQHFIVFLLVFFLKMAVALLSLVWHDQCSMGG